WATSTSAVAARRWKTCSSPSLAIRCGIELARLDMAGSSPPPGGGGRCAWRRDFVSWESVSGPFLVAALRHPIFYRASVGYGLGRFVANIDGLPYAVFLTPGILATAAMNSASFETTFGSFTRLHEQNTFAAILATPCSVADIVAGDLLWAATK